MGIDKERFQKRVQRVVAKNLAAGRGERVGDGRGAGSCAVNIVSSCFPQKNSEGRQSMPPRQSPSTYEAEFDRA